MGSEKPVRFFFNRGAKFYLSPCTPDIVGITFARNDYYLVLVKEAHLMRFIMAAVTFALAVTLLPSYGFPDTVGVKLKAPNASQQSPKKSVKK